jgi:hypothetical protein
MSDPGAAGDPCAAPTPRFYSLGERLTILPDTVIYQDVAGTCTSVAAPTADFYAIEAELTPDRFVEGARTYTDSGRLAVSQVDGADGSRFCDVLGPLRDRGLSDHSCLVQTGEDGAIRCLPGDVGPSQVFAEALCGTSIEVALLDECHQDATYVADPAGALCPLARRVRTIDDALGDPVYAGSPESCVQIPPEQVAHAIGASISPFSLAELTRDNTPAGGERLQRGDLVTSDGLRLFQLQWFDPVLEEPCAFAAAADGAERCLPIDSPLELTLRVTSRFTDDVCTAPITVAFREASCAGGDPRFVVESFGAGLTRVYEAGPAQPGPLYRLDAATCVEEPVDSLFYRVGPEILPQRFVGGIEMVE